MSFLMENDGRARKAVKQLRSFASDHGITLVNREARTAIAQMYGYADWPELLASLGQGRSEDDAHVDAAEREARRSRQLRVLLELGLSEAAANEGVQRLALTARSAEDADELPSIRPGKMIQYHPIRLGVAIGALIEHDLMSAGNREDDSFSGADPGFARFMAADDYSVEEIQQMLSGIVDDEEAGDGLIPMDVENWNIGMFYKLVDQADEVMHSGLLIDASATAASVADVEPSPRALSLLAGRPLRYIHFGRNAFASPFYACGIEGAYLSVAAEDDGFAVTLTPVAGSETGPRDALIVMATPEEVLQEVRAIDLEIRLDREGDEIMGEPGTYEDAAVGWGDYYEPVLNAAIASAARELEGGLDVVDGLSPSIPEEDVRRFLRARTREKREAVARDLAEAYSTMVVRYVGQGEHVEAECDVDLPLEPFWHNSVLLQMATRSQDPELVYDLAVRAADLSSRMLDPVEEAWGDPFDESLLEAVKQQGDWADVRMIWALVRLGDYRDAVEYAFDCLQADNAFAGEVLVHAAPAAVEGKAREEAEVLLLRVHNLIEAIEAPGYTDVFGRTGPKAIEYSGIAALAWTRVLLAAWLFGTETATEVADFAMECNPQVAPRMFNGKEPDAAPAAGVHVAPGSVEEAERIIDLQFACWKKIDLGKEIFRRPAEATVH